MKIEDKAKTQELGKINIEYLSKEFGIIQTNEIIITDIDTNLNVVVRIALATDVKGLKNSVMTCYRIRDSNLKKLVKNNMLLYKRE